MADLTKQIITCNLQHLVNMHFPQVCGQISAYGTSPVEQLKRSCMLYSILEMQILKS